MHLNDDYILCLECKKPFKQINMLHLRIHDYETVNEYKDKFKIPYRTPLCSVNTSKLRSENIDQEQFERIKNRGAYKAGKSQSLYKKQRLSEKIKKDISDGRLIMKGGRKKDGSVNQLKWEAPTNTDGE